MKFSIQGLKMLEMTLSKWGFWHVFTTKMSKNWDSCSQYHGKLCMRQFWGGSGSQGSNIPT
jgi:hypothetical protein